MQITNLPERVDAKLKAISNSPEELKAMRLYADAVGNTYLEIQGFTYYQREGWNSINASVLRQSVPNHVPIRKKLIRCGIIECELDEKNRLKYSKVKHESNRQRLIHWDAEKWVYRTVDRNRRATKFKGAVPELKQGYKDAVKHFDSIGIDAMALVKIYTLLASDNKHANIDAEALTALCIEANTGIENVDVWLQSLDEVTTFSEDAIRLSDKHEALNKDRTKSERYYTIFRARHATRAVVEVILGLNRVTSYKQKGNRISSNISNLPSYLKEFVRFESGKYVFEVDIPNSQVGFSWIIALEDMPECSDKLNYFKAISQGDLYQIIADDNGISRTDAKDEFFKFFFGSPAPYWRYLSLPASKTFKRLFPKVFEFYTDLKKREGYAELAIRSQMMESKFLFTKVVPFMATVSHPFYTTHDSVTFSTDSIKEAEQIKEVIEGIYNIETGLGKSIRLRHLGERVWED